MPFTRFDHNLPPPPDKNPQKTRIIKITLNIIGYTLMAVVLIVLVYILLEYIDISNTYEAMKTSQ